MQAVLFKLSLKKKKKSTHRPSFQATDYAMTWDFLLGNVLNIQ